MANKEREANANLMGWMISSNFSESTPNVFTGAKGVLRCFSAASMRTARHSLKYIQRGEGPTITGTNRSCDEHLNENSLR